MKEIKLKRLVLSNWKSLNLDVTFSEKDTRISGRNGIGKSSLQSAWNWLLSSYTNATSPKNHELFDNRVELSHETPIASVKAWIAIDGIEYTIEKTAQAKFTRRRGTNEYVKENSDTYKILLDEIEISSTQFGEWLDHNICDTDMLVYCLDGSFFSVLAEEDKKKARKILKKIVGEIKETDYTGDYSCLMNDFAKGYTIEQIEERTKNQIKPIKERMSKIPTLIEDKERLLSEYEKTDYTAIEKQVTETRQDIQKIDDQILGNGESIKPILGQRDAIFDLINSKTLKLNERRNAYVNAFNAVRNEIKGKINSVEQINTSIKSRNYEKQIQYNNWCREIDDAEKRIVYLKGYLDVLRKRKEDLKKQGFNNDTCPYCQQDLPMEMLEKAKAKFNQQKQEDLAYIVAQGKQTKAEIESLEKRIAEIKPLAEVGITYEKEIDYEELELSLASHEANFKPFETTDEYESLAKEIEELNASLPELPKNDNDELTGAKNALLNRLESLNQQLGGKSKATQIKAEIDTLKCELRDLGNDVAKLEGVIAKCKEYVQERADIISSRVNDKLTSCTIQMWEQQKNGEMVGSCIITDNDGVKFSTLNHSKRLKLQIELQRLFNAHNDIIMPIWVDESGCFDSYSLPKYDNTQMMHMFASDESFLTIG